MKPHITMKYKKKIRLLVTNACPRNCSYCHNEGMHQEAIQHLDPSKIEYYLPSIKKYTNRIVLSGGEPFVYCHLDQLVDMLSSYGFDITLITANIIPSRLASISYGIKNLHYSIHNLQEMDNDLRILRWLNDFYPNIRVTLNVPFTELKIIEQYWDTLYQLAIDVGANIQFIKIFSVRNVIHLPWPDRWADFLFFLKSKARFLEATQREARFITKELIKIDLLDIPCQSAGPEYANGMCLSNSDITIDPSMKLSICRWTDSAVPLYEDDIPIPFDEVLRQATIKSCDRCTHGNIHGYLHDNELDYYLNAPHYTWPTSEISILDTYSKTFPSDISYYGKSGSILRLENLFAKFIGTNYALSVNSGTTSVYLACLSLGLSENDEILMPVATFPTLVAALLSAGIKVRLCDIDPHTGNISINALCSNINANVKAVLITHLWGLPVDMVAIQKICHKFNIYIIEDCSHAYGAHVNNQIVGSFGDIACFSLQANKAVYAGEGGMLVTSNRVFYERAVTLSSSVDRILDCVKSIDYLKYWGTGIGSKLKLNPLGAPLALLSLANLNEVNHQRGIRAAIIEHALKRSPLFCVIEPHTNQYQRVYYTNKLVLADDYIEYRDILLKKLIEKGLEASTTSFIPIYQHEISTNEQIINASEEFHGADLYYQRIISIPAFVYEPIELVQHYAATIMQISDLILKMINGD